jgi:hypothetical protein
MSTSPHSKATPPTSFHVQDCYVWSEIYYLDSSTDYHEYLPQNTRSGFGEFMLLDSSRSFLRYTILRLWPSRERLLTLMLGALALGFLVAVALDSF